MWSIFFQTQHEVIVAEFRNGLIAWAKIGSLASEECLKARLELEVALALAGWCNTPAEMAEVAQTAWRSQCAHLFPGTSILVLPLVETVPGYEYVEGLPT